MAASRLRPPVLPGGLDAPERAEARSHTQLACRLARTPARAAGHSQREGAFTQGLAEGWRGYFIWAEWRLFGTSRPPRYLTLAIGDRRAAGHGMGGRAPGEARPPGPFLLGKRSHALLGHWHCHSVVNVRSGTLRGEWQCSAHCHPASSVPKRCDQGRVAVRPVRSGASGSASHTATRR